MILQRVFLKHDIITSIVVEDLGIEDKDDDETCKRDIEDHRRQEQ